MRGGMRARDLGITIGTYPTGPLNAITDVAGVEVGHTTVRWGGDDLPAGQGPARTGVTAIWPRRYDPAGGADDLLTRPVAAGFFALAGTGELTGRSEIEELGRINTPIVLTSTMAVGTAYDATCRYLVARDERVGGSEGVVIPIVGECDDEYLNDARGFHVTHEHVWRALDDASGGPVAEGCVGSGTGMTCFGFKGGIGTSSRVVATGEERWVAGVLAMTNFGRRSRLTVDGVPVGREIPWGSEAERPEASHGGDRVDGSCIVVVATDAPLDGRQLARLAKRAALGLGRTGSAGENGSGELLVAFSTGYRPGQGAGVSTQRIIEGEGINDLFAAVVDATEEAVLNSLYMAETTTGAQGRTIHALPLERVRALLAGYGRLG